MCDLGPHCLSLYLTMLNNVSKHVQQTTKADGIFRWIFAGVLRVKQFVEGLHPSCYIAAAKAIDPLVLERNK